MPNEYDGILIFWVEDGNVTSHLFVFYVLMEKGVGVNVIFTIHLPLFGERVICTYDVVILFMDLGLGFRDMDPSVFS